MHSDKKTVTRTRNLSTNIEKQKKNLRIDWILPSLWVFLSANVFFHKNCVNIHICLEIKFESKHFHTKKIIALKLNKTGLRLPSFTSKNQKQKHLDFAFGTLLYVSK